MFMALVLCLSLLPATAMAAGGAWDGVTVATSFAGGSGTENDPYLITNGEQLAHLKDFLGPNHSRKFFKLTADIDLGGQPWTPIGTGIGYDAFQGHLIGDGHTVSNLSVCNNSHAGLFGYIASAEICDMTIKDATVSGKSAGAFVGTVSGNANLCNLHLKDSDISSTYAAGGIVGEIASSSGYTTTVCCSSVENGAVKATGSGYGSGAHAGGIVGDFSSSGGRVYIQRSYCAAGNVTSRSGCAGGILGSSAQRCDSTAPAFHILNCYNTAPISITGVPVANKQNAAGGIAGFVWRTQSDIKYCYNSGTISTTNGTNASYAAGIGGYGTALTYGNCFNFGTVTTTNASTSRKPTLGTISNYGGTVTSCWYVQDSLDPSVKASCYTKNAKGTSTTADDATQKANTALINNGDGWKTGSSDLPVLKNCVEEGEDKCSCTTTCTCHCGPMRLPVPPTPHTVTFDSQGGTSVTSQSVDDGEVASKPDPAPTKTGYTFYRWTTDQEGETEYDFSQPVTEDITLYAQWKELVKLTAIQKELVEPTSIPAGVTLSSKDTDGKYVIKDGKVTLLYKITVTGTAGAKFIVTDEDATLVGGNVTQNPTAKTISGTIAAGSTTAEFYVVKTFVNLANTAGTVSNTAYIKAGDNTDNEVTPPDGQQEDAEKGGVPSKPVETDVTPALPKLSITKEVTPLNGVKVGGVLTYTITVKNDGAADATNVVVTDQLASALEYVRGSSDPFDCTVADKTNVLTWNLGNIAAGQSASVTFKVKATATGEFENEASAKCDEVPEPVETETPATSKVFKLDIKKGHKTPIAVDETTGTATVEYTVTVTNNSGFDLYGLDIIDTLTPEIIGNASASLTLHPKTLTMGGTPVGTLGGDSTPKAETGEATPRTWEVLGRNATFPDKSTVTLTYDIVVKNTSKTEQLTLKLNNKVMGGSWIAQDGSQQSQPDPQIMPALDSFMAANNFTQVLSRTVLANSSGGKDYDASVETSDKTDIGSDSSTVVIPPVTDMVDVIFDPNGGTWEGGATEPKKVGEVSKGTPEVPANLYPAQPTAPAEKQFDKWSNPEIDSTTGNITIKALWKDKDPEAKTYTLTYNANGGTNSMASQTGNSATGSYTFYTQANGFTAPMDKKWKEWNTQADGKGNSYGAGVAFRLTDSDVNGTLYAIWEDIIPADTYYTVTYHSNNGADNQTKDTVKSTDSYTTRYNTFSAPDGKEFKGWNTLADGSGAHYAANESIPTLTDNLDLYAQWGDKAPDPEPEMVTVTWVNGVTNAQIGVQKRIKKGSTVPLSEYPDAPFNEGWRFVRWEEPVIDPITGSITIRASYVELQQDPSAPSYEYLRDTVGVKVNVVCDIEGSGHGQTGFVQLKPGSYEPIRTDASHYTIRIYPDAYVNALPGDHSTAKVPYQDVPLEYVPAPEQGSVETQGITPGNDAAGTDELNAPAIPQEGVTPSNESAPSGGDDANTGNIGNDSNTPNDDIERMEKTAPEVFAAVSGSWQLVTGSSNEVTFHVQCEVKQPDEKKVTVIWQDANGNQLRQEVIPADGSYDHLYPGDQTTTGHWGNPVRVGDTITIRWEEPPAPTTYLLTIYYQYENGMQALSPRTERREAGSGFDIASPPISYYSANPRVVSGIMPANDYSVTVIYSYIGGYDPGYNPGYTPDYTPPSSYTPAPTPTPATPDTGTTITDDQTPLAGSVGLNDTDHFAYVIGYEDDTVRPLNNITRAEAATIFFRLMTDEYRQANWSTTNSFSDVNAGDWYNNAVSTCANAGVLKGYEDGTFRPNAPITRAEFASMAAGFMDASITDDGTGDFSDTANHWAAASIRRAAKAGWVTGNGNKFNPDAKITRAEVMTIVNRMLDRTPDAEHMLPTMKKWIDNPEDAWYYEAVQEATNEHEYERDELNVETWTELLTERDWKALETEWANNGGASAPKADDTEAAQRMNRVPDGI
jgi:uncharacterized repeat protein (TIGR01451 family)/uncharacterized repeat protein (TIGR02543 family)